MMSRSSNATRRSDFTLDDGNVTGAMSRFSTEVDIPKPARRRRAALVLAAAILAGMHAPDSASAATLTELFAGASIDAGNARFSNWQLLSLDASAAVAPNLSLVTVTPLASDLANPGLQFAGGGQLGAIGLNNLGLTFRYRVQAIGAMPTSFAGHSLAMTGITFGGDGGLGLITQDSLDLGSAALGSTVALADHVNEFFQFNSATAHAPHLNLTVNVDILLQGTETTDTIALTAFTQRFAQTGPTTLAGDFNQDKKVDGGDFLAWQRGQSPTPLSAADLATWRTNFGANLYATPMAAPALTATPEPTTGSLLMVAAAAIAGGRRRFYRGKRVW
jgi:hypothetical protein